MTGFQLMIPPFVACMVLVAMLSYLGLHVIAREVIFVDLSLAQIAALGTTVAYLAGYDLHSSTAYLFSLGFTFLTGGMGFGAAFLLVIAYIRGGFAPLAAFGPAQWTALVYLAAVGTPTALYLWVFALPRASPTRVASTMAMHPVSASILRTPAATALSPTILNKPISPKAPTWVPPQSSIE